MSNDKIMPTLSDEKLAQNNQELVMEDIGKRMFNPKLMALRAQMPFIPIMPFPNETLGYLLAPNVPVDINIPPGIKAIMFSGSDEYYVSRKGNSQIPGPGVPTDCTGIMNPEFFLWYVEEINQLSAVSAVACRLTVHCFLQL